MQSVLGPGTPPTLDSLLMEEKIALFLDFDGTLVELANGPDAIAPVPEFARRCAGLANRLQGRCALVTGRAIEDIERHVGPLNVAIAGSHGADIRDAGGAALGDVAIALPKPIEMALRAFAAENDIDYEHKAHGGALHYRRNPGKGDDANAFARKLAQAHGWSAQSGKCVIEIVAGTSDKGSAVRTFLDTGPFRGARPFFIGDDLTDEAGFAACNELGGAGIIVGPRKETTAQYRLLDVSSVHKWLEI